MRIAKVDNMPEIMYRSEQGRRYAELEAMYLDLARYRLEHGFREPAKGSVTVAELLTYLARETQKTEEEED